MPIVLVMAYYARSAPPKPKVLTNEQLIRRFAIANVVLYLLAAGVWLSIRYTDSKSPWAVRETAARRPEPPPRNDLKAPGILLPDSLRYIAEVTPGDTDHAPIAKSEFSTAMGRLDRALDARKEFRREAVIRAANDNAHGAASQACAITWNDGEPVLLLEAPKNGQISLSRALNRCAQAVEKLP